jgi:thiosulfate dehydrogenase (quinone) large subunit
MGPSNVVEVPNSVAPPEVDHPESQPVEQPASSNGVHGSTRSSVQPAPAEGSSPGAPNQELGLSAWLYRSHVASVLWLGVRLWLGYEWFNAGYQKIWGSEKAAFWFGHGAAVKGFATAGVVGSASGKGGASYGWWAGFLHNFVVPNASWIGRLISVGELVIGVALILGLLTGVAAFAGLSLNIIYMFSGSAGVNPMYAIAAVFLVLAWRNAGWFGLDRFVLRSTTWTRNRRIAGANATHRRVANTASAS